MDIIYVLITALIAILALAIYLLPAIIAYNREHKNRMPVLIINLFLGWTGMFWVLSLDWATSHQDDQPASTLGSNGKIWKMSAGLVLIVIVALLAANLMASGGTSNMLAKEGITGTVAPSAPTAGVPMSADDFLQGQ